MKKQVFTFVDISLVYYKECKFRAPLGRDGPVWRYWQRFVEEVRLSFLTFWFIFPCNSPGHPVLWLLPCYSGPSLTLEPLHNYDVWLKFFVLIVFDILKEILKLHRFMFNVDKGWNYCWFGYQTGTAKFFFLSTQTWKVGDNLRSLGKFREP